MSYEVGATYKSICPIAGATSATILVTTPDQEVAPLETITDEGTGELYAYLTFVQEGLHKFTWSDLAMPRHIQSDYVNVTNWRSVLGADEVKTYIGDDDVDTDDPILRQVMAAATELAEGVVGTCVPARHVNERIAGSSQTVLRMPHAPLINTSAIESITSVWPNGPTWTTSQLIVYPDSGTVEVANQWLPFYYGPWSATYTSGRMVIPESIQLAVKEIIFDMWSIQRPYGSASLAPGPDETAKFEQMVMSYRIPPHAKLLLGQYELPGFA